MEELKIFDLYEKFNTKTAEEFMDKIDSTVDIKAEYEKVIEDTEWIEIMEETVPYIDNILRNPNRFIVNEEEIVKIELARKITVESIKHLSKNTNLIQDYDKKTGDVRPSKILNINKEENYDTYENRFIYTLIQNMKFFINKKKKAVEERQKISEKNNKELSYTGNSNYSKEKVEISIKLSTSLNSDKNNKQNNKENVLERIEKLERKITDLTCAEVYKIIDKKHITLVTSPIKKTNVILKNQNFKIAVKLWESIYSGEEDEEDEKNNLNSDGNAILKGFLDHSFLIDYFVLDSVNVSKREQKRKIAKRAILLLTEEIHRIISLLISMGVKIDDEQLLKMIAQEIKNERAQRLVGAEDVKKKFQSAMDDYLERTKEYL